LTSALPGGKWSASRPGHFTPRKRAPSTHWIGGWVSDRASLGRCGEVKILTYQDSNSNPSVAQPIGSCYTDCATSAHT
jgi:hypothetical protein